jgi:4-hydroxybenzoate-CoA ligase
VLIEFAVERRASREEALIRDSYGRPYNAATEFVDDNVARGLGRKIAFVDPQRSLTYAQLQAQTCRLARALRRMGLRPEERMALLLYDTVEFPMAFWSAIRAGIVVIPLNTLLNAEQYAYILADSRAGAIVVAAELLATLRPVLDRLPCLRLIVVVGAKAQDLQEFASGRVHRIEDLLAAESSEPFTADTVADEVALWLYTSGSTGHPKGVKHVHSSLMATAKLFGQGVLGIGPDDVVYSAAKLYFAYGLGNAMSFPMSVGATSILLPQRATPELVLDLMRRHHPTIFYAVPTLYAALLAHRELGACVGSNRLRMCVSAGEALPAALGKRWQDVVGVDILDGLGSTEMLQTFLSNRPGDVRYGSTGRAVEGYELKIVDDNGRELDDGEIGELIVRGPSAGDGYWHQRAKSLRTFVGEWTYTGDKFFRDRDGYYYCCGRTDDMFKVSGMWVSPFDVEAALLSHEAVLEAAVVGHEDADGLTKPKAVLVLKDGYVADEALLEAIKRHVKERAGPWKYPRWFDIRQELPKTPTGKTQRFKLRQRSEA